MGLHNQQSSQMCMRIVCAACFVALMMKDMTTLVREMALVLLVVVVVVMVLMLTSLIQFSALVNPDLQFTFTLMSEMTDIVFTRISVQLVNDFIIRFYHGSPDITSLSNMSGFANIIEIFIQF